MVSLFLLPLIGLNMMLFDLYPEISKGVFLKLFRYLFIIFLFFMSFYVIFLYGGPRSNGVESEI